MIEITVIIILAYEFNFIKILSIYIVEVNEDNQNGFQLNRTTTE
jgi:hypothetical protein